MIRDIDDNPIEKVAIIAGSGWLPRHVYDDCIKKGIEALVIKINDTQSDDPFTGVDYESISIYAVNKLISKLKADNIKHVVLAGAVKRANISRLLLDLKGAKLFAMIMKGGLADNSLLKTIISFFEMEGFIIVPPEQIATSILADSGNINSVKPSKSALSDIKKGIEILRAIANFDVGQSLVIQNGLVLGVEAAEGTDELIKRCGLIQQRDEESCILIKVVKPNQDLRVDLPCIGVETIKNLHRYNFKGVSVEAGSALILNKEQTIEEANKLDIFIYGA